MDRKSVWSQIAIRSLSNNNQFEKSCLPPDRELRELLRTSFYWSKENLDWER